MPLRKTHGSVFVSLAMNAFVLTWDPRAIAQKYISVLEFRVWIASALLGRC